MTVSVAMAVYNGENFIIQQLKTLAGQSRRIDEVIIVDDGSTDRTVSLIREFIFEYGLSHRWKVFINKERLGYVANFDRALSLTTKDVIFLCDQDDIWHLDKVERLMQIMDRHEEVLAVASTYNCIDDGGHRIDTRSPILTANHGLIMLKNYRSGCLYKIKRNDILERCISMGCTTCYRRRVVEEYLRLKQQFNKYCAAGDEINKVSHDWFLDIVAGLNDGMYFANEPLVGYRIHSGNTIGIKTNSEDIGLDYRIGEYEKYIETYEIMAQLLSQEPVRDLRRKWEDIEDSKETVLHDRAAKHVVRWSKFIKERRKALSNQSVESVVKIGLKSIPTLGIKSALAIPDAMTIRRECNSKKTDIEQQNKDSKRETKE